MASSDKDFPELLKHYLKQNKRSRSWLADELGVDRATIKRWCEGTVKKPSKLEDVIKAADALEINDLQKRQEFIAAAGYAVNLPASEPKTSDDLKPSPADPASSAPDPTGFEDGTQQWQLEISQAVKVVQHLGQEMNYLRQDLNQPARDTPPDLHRQDVLQKIQTIWIDGYLQQTVHDAVYLQPIMADTPESLLRRPWNLKLRSDKHAVPEDVSIYDLYIRYGRNLLILGEPASGKTITLLQLVETLIVEAQSNDTYPVPIMLPLSSWGRERLPLEEWLVGESFLNYQMAHEQTRRWLAQDRIALLLDGLDEVSVEYREDCITAINDFKAKYPVPLVVCSRTEDYHHLQERLNLTGAITVQPLTPSQIEEYLLEFGDRTEGIRVALAEDTELQKFVESPLMLYLVVLTYEGETPHDLLEAGSVQTLHQRLFQNYVAHIFQLRALPENHPYDRTQALDWLANLAFGMQRHSQSIFFIEGLQPSWFSTETEWKRYKSTIWLVVGLCVSMLMLIFTMMFGDLDEPWLSIRLSLFFGCASGVYVFLLLKRNDRLGENDWLGITDNIELQEELYWSHPSQEPFIVYVWRWLRTGLGGGLGCGIAFGLFGLGLGLLIGFVGILLGRPPDFGVTGWLLNWLIAGLTGLLGCFIGGLVIGFVYQMGAGIFAGLRASIHKREVGTTVHPNQGIHASFRNACLWGVVTGLALGIWGGIVGVVAAPLEWLSFKELYIILGVSMLDRFVIALYAIMIGLAVGLIVGFFTYGGKTVMQHYVLRMMLSRENILPYPLRDTQLAAYLDDMAERILLRRVGGGWMFIHRYLRDYFAAQNPNYTPESTASTHESKAYQ